jgi:hypothetical protein
MSYDDSWFDEPGDELTDDEYPEDDGLDDDETDTAPCPKCGAPIYEDAFQCPVCGTYVTPGSSLWAGRPAWWILLGVLGLAATILALAHLFPR